MLKQTFNTLTTILLLLAVKVNAQYLWYENENKIENIVFSGDLRGTFTKDQPNPSNTNNSNTTVSKFVRDANVSSAFAYFNLPQPIETPGDYIVNLKAYIDIPTANLPSSGNRLRVYLTNTNTTAPTERKYVTVILETGQTWLDLSFVFNASDFTERGLANGGYNQVSIGYGNGKETSTPITYYVDSITATTEQQLAGWLQGSWGITYPVYGGLEMDNAIDNGYDYYRGVDQIVNDLPNVGHVITNLSYFAHSHFFTLRRNSNVDVANVLHPDMLPSIGNDEIIFDVLQELKDSGKKIILYISTNYFDQVNVDSEATLENWAEVRESWENYYRNFNGATDRDKEYAAYRDLMEGFILEMKDYADGYWLDTTNQLTEDDNLNDFISMVRAADPGALVTSGTGTYLTNENGEEIEVDTDGLQDVIGDTDDDYRIVLYDPVDHDVNIDYTNGHVTPLGQGAPPNSWAYDEFTLPNMIENPWANLNGKPVLKHAWFPIRERWHRSRSEIMFEVEQAYRFVKNITDAGGAVTFANTTIHHTSDPENAGLMMVDEMDIMLEINNRLNSNATPEPYVRPIGAFLVGEEAMYPWYENADGLYEDYISFSSALNGSITEDFATPINITETSARFIRNGNPSRVHFNLPKVITAAEVSSLKISLDIYAMIGDVNEELGDLHQRIRVYLYNTNDNDTRIYQQVDIDYGRTWETLVFDFNNIVTNTTEYNQIAIGFANGEIDSPMSTRYFIDNIKGSINMSPFPTENNTSIDLSSREVSSELFTNKDSNTSTYIYPNPVSNTFELSKEFNSVEIYNIMGQKILGFAGVQTSFNISELSSGVYLLKCYHSNGTSETIRFFKK